MKKLHLNYYNKHKQEKPMSDNYNPHRNSVLITENPETEPFSEADKKFLAEEEAKEQQPEKILGKFDSQEDLQKAYQELEKKFHEPRNDQVQDNNVEDPKLPSEQTSEDNNKEGNAEPSEENTNTEDNTERTGVAEAYQALQEAGEVNEEIYAKFEEAGVPKELVDHVQELENYKAANEMKQMTAEVEDYNALTEWAGKNLSESEIDTYDNIMQNGTPDEMRFAIKNLDARMRADNPKPKSNLIKADAVSQASGTYNSTAEVQRDMKDPRYSTDSAYRAKVHAKLAKSNV